MMLFYLEHLFSLPQIKSKYISIWKLEILRPILYPYDIMCNLPEGHLPLAPEARLGSRAPGSEMTTLLMLPVAGLPAQVSMCPIRVGACVAGGQGPAFMGLLFLWGGCDILDASLRRWCLMASE